MTPSHAAPLLVEADLLRLCVELLAAPDDRAAPAAAASDLALLLERTDLPHAPDLADLARELAARAAFAGLAAEHTRLFDAAIACPVHEAAYVRRPKGPLLADIAAFHRAFGLTLDPAAHDRVDHLGAELELLSLLAVMEHLADLRGDPDAAAVTRDAFRDFAVDHPDTWIRGFCTHLAERAAHPFYALLATFIGILWDALAARRALPTDPAAAPAAELDLDSPYACGMAHPACLTDTARSDAR